MGSFFDPNAKIEDYVATRLSPFILVNATQEHDGMIQVIIREVGMKGEKNNAQICHYFKSPVTMTKDQRVSYLKHMANLLCRNIDSLFANCEQLDCPQCGGHDVTHI